RGGGASLLKATVGQTAAGGIELLAFGFVTPLFDAVFADRLRVALLPDVGQQLMVVRGTCEQLIQYVFDVNPDVEVVPPCAAHQGHHHRTLLAPSHAAHEEPRLPPHRNLLHQLLNRIVVNGDATVADVDIERWPVVANVVQ